MFTDLGRLLPLLIPVIVIQLGLAVVALVDLFRRERVKLLPKWAWAIAIILVNFIGPILYFVLGRDE